MARSKNSTRAPNLAQPTPAPSQAPRRRPPIRWFGAAILISLLGLMIALSLRPVFLSSATGPAPAHPSTVAPASFVGSQSCRGCHEAEFKAWTGSHHELAMQKATPDTVLGDFNNASFESFGVKTEFFKRDGAFMVRTDGPDGRMAEYPVQYTFGVFPLQQYLVPFPGGRYQALPIAWDSRPKDAGGQRWFHLSPTEKIDHTDQLHWTGRYQNWNLMCAECHSTNLRKGYDAAGDSYHTTFSEINVACEACHGPGSRHADWARQNRGPYRPGTDMGLTVSLRSDWASAWRFTGPDSPFPVRTTPPRPETADVCAACHARRSTISEDRPLTPAAPLEQTHRLALLTEPLYHPDGRQRDEVYVWGSFLQSRMHERGVTCLDCHEPHSLQLRAPGNQVCFRCHVPTLFDTPQHHHHKAESTGASCTACHMPTESYMVVHPRLDHSIRVPRPDLATADAPDACTKCHADQTQAWAASAMDKWYGAAWRNRPPWAPALVAGRTGDPRAVPSLLALAQDTSAPAIVRATAGQLAGSSGQADPAKMLVAARAMLSDADPSVRIAGLAMFEGADAAARAASVAPLLSDSIRGVRLEAARLLADIPASSLSQEHAAARDRAMDEYEASLRLNDDWPAASVNTASLELRRGHVPQAIAALQRAIRLDDRFVGAYVNLADVYRQQHQDAECEAVLRRGIAVVPGSADLHHALGLRLVRAGDRTGALAELATAAANAPTNARYAYVHAVALHSTGDVTGALAALRQARTHAPYDPDILTALISFLRERDNPGDRAEALGYARALAEVMPNDAGIQQTIRDLSTPR